MLEELDYLPTTPYKVWAFHLGLIPSTIDKANDLDYWLGLNKWSKVEAAKLFCGISPLASEECDAVGLLLRLMPSIGEQSPIEWLKWLDAIGYADCVPRQLIRWYERMPSEHKARCKETEPMKQGEDCAGKSKGRRPAQIELLLKVIDEHCKDRMSIPIGIKQVVMSECLKETKVFSSKSVFNKVWSKLSASKKISIEAKEKYL